MRRELLLPRTRLSWEVTSDMPGLCHVHEVWKNCLLLSPQRKLWHQDRLDITFHYTYHVLSVQCRDVSFDGKMHELKNWIHCKCSNYRHFQGLPAALQLLFRGPEPSSLFIVGLLTVKCCIAQEEDWPSAATNCSTSLKEMILNIQTFICAYNA